jgi:hypothetical protein
MAVNFSNIITGEGDLEIAQISTLGVIGSYVDLGATQDGAEISWEPDMVDIEIDQFGDAARVIVSKIKVSVKTKLAEATLQNLAYAWNLETTGTGDELLENTPTGYTTLRMGLQSVYPVERSIKITGTAPGSSGLVTKTRVYTCNRVVQYDSSAHTLKRAENISFPVHFRLLPDTNATGREYGTIIDQVT